MEIVIALLLIIGGIGIFDVLASRFGVDSRTLDVDDRAGRVVRGWI
jgi:hypothetical protein